MPRVFESPDGGQTVYSREVGSAQRQLHTQTQSLRDQNLHTQLWHSIHTAAQQDPVLQEMLKQIEVYHTLKNIP